MTANLNGTGYWLVASDGGVFSYNAPFQGSTGSIKLNQPVVGMALDRATGGYWLVASDGGVFSYNAPFFGSTGSIKLNKPVVGLAPVSDGSGYRLIASDGGVFSYDAPVLRFDRGHQAEQARRRPGSTTTPTTATGWSLPTAGSSPSALPERTCRSTDQPPESLLSGGAAQWAGLRPRPLACVLSQLRAVVALPRDRQHEMTRRADGRDVSVGRRSLLDHDPLAGRRHLRREGGRSAIGREVRSEVAVTRQSLLGGVHVGVVRRGPRRRSRRRTSRSRGRPIHRPGHRVKRAAVLRFGGRWLGHASQHVLDPVLQQPTGADSRARLHLFSQLGVGDGGVIGPGRSFQRRPGHGDPGRAAHRRRRQRNRLQPCRYSESSPFSSPPSRGIGRGSLNESVTWDGRRT